MPPNFRHLNIRVTEQEWKEIEEVVGTSYGLKLSLLEALSITF